jgi:hypothetical protein
VYQAYPIALQRLSERFDFFQALVGDLRAEALKRRGRA